jgi:hypothetical protein
MQVPYNDGIASHIGPSPCAGVREDAGEASAGGIRHGQGLRLDHEHAQMTPQLSQLLKALACCLIARVATAMTSAWPEAVSSGPLAGILSFDGNVLLGSMVPRLP